VNPGNGIASYFRTVGMVSLCIVSLWGDAHAQDEGLYGVREIRIEVGVPPTRNEVLEKNLRTAGLTVEQLIGAVRGRIEAHGSRPKITPNARHTLLIHVLASPEDGDPRSERLAVWCDLRIVERTQRKGGPGQTYRAETILWEGPALFTSTRRKLRKDILWSVSRRADHLASAYAGANDPRRF
jgi:hypothetical protein